MYWNLPLIECHWPRGPDPLPGLLGDQYLLLWQPRFDFCRLQTNQTLGDLCDWANTALTQGIDSFVADVSNHYDIANVVKLNMWTKDIQQQGMVKPWLILDWGDNKLEAGTGDSRLRLCEILPEIRTVAAFISTHRSRYDCYPGCESITTLDRLGQLCGARANQHFLFRGTDGQAPFGIYWYEFDSDLTRAVTPAQDWCVSAFRGYYATNPQPITPKWFLSAVDWCQFGKTGW